MKMNLPAEVTVKLHGDTPEMQLIIWRLAYEQRDMLIREALVQGLSKNRISKVTGLARTTIDRILANDQPN